MNQNEIYHLIERYNAGNASEEETAFLESWYLDLAAKPSTLAQTEVNAAESIMLANLKRHIAARQRIKLWPRFIGVAAAVIGIAVCVYFFTTPRHPDASLSSRANAKDLNDIPPGGNRATLTAANGSTINLSEKQTGVVVGDDLKYTDGTDIAPLSSRANAKDLSIQTLTTPRGGTYSIVLQDGTKVWLNADSKLEFFSNYRNKLQRIVKLIKGEAYLEVAKDAKRPFIVECNGQRTEVLGTHFNISAYGDDNGIRTTLLEGSVRVSSSLSSRANAKDLNTDLPTSRDKLSEVGMTKRGEGVTLKPNQQSTILYAASGSAGGASKITVKEVDASQAIAWKNGRFAYKNTTVDAVMRQIARWYNVDITYESPELKGKLLSGTVSRYEHISGILRAISLTGVVNFKVNNKTVTVTKP